MGSSYDIAEIIIKEPIVKMTENGITSNIEGGTLEIKDATFSYPTKPSVQILDHMNIEIPTNKVIAFVGASGCGKSSII
jgi:ABC-type multidrug transport system fused ATPase/permease subunit